MGRRPAADRCKEHKGMRGVFHMGGRWSLYQWLAQEFFGCLVSPSGSSYSSHFSLTSSDRERSKGRRVSSLKRRPPLPVRHLAAKPGFLTFGVLAGLGLGRGDSVKAGPAGEVVEERA